jgi:hypothetical protein
MKKASVAIVGLLMVASMAMAETNVTSVNVVGYSKIQIPPDKYVLVTLPFRNVTDGSDTVTLSSLIGDQLPTDSTVYLWSRVTKTYTTISKSARGGWGTSTVKWGDAFWLRVPGSLVTNEVSLQGEVPYFNNNGDDFSVTISNIDAVAYAFPVDRYWTNTSLAQGAATDDTLYIWNPVTQTYQTYTKTARGGWSSAYNVVLKAGQSFWFKPKTGSKVWTETVPYSL